MGELQTLSRHEIATGLRRLDLLCRLSGRDLDVLRRLARGQRQADIAAEVFLSASQVARIVASLVCELGAANVANAVAIAYEVGLLGPGDASADG